MDDLERWLDIANYIDKQIKTICPILGISFTNPDDKTTWIINFDPSATKKQQQDAQTVIDNFNGVAPARPQPFKDFISLLNSKSDLLGKLNAL